MKDEHLINLIETKLTHLSEQMSEIKDDVEEIRNSLYVDDKSIMLRLHDAESRLEEIDELKKSWQNYKLVIVTAFIPVIISFVASFWQSPAKPKPNGLLPALSKPVYKNYS